MTSIPEVKDVVASVQLVDVRLVQLSAHTAIRRPSDVGPVDVPVRWGAEVETGTDAVFLVRATIEVRVVPREKRDKPAVQIEAVFELSYRLPDQMVVPGEVLAEFASTNGIFNAWPYARQLVHEISQRMQLPPLVLPLLRLPELSLDLRESPQQGPDSTVRTETGPAGSDTDPPQGRQATPPKRKPRRSKRLRKA